MAKPLLLILLYILPCSFPASGEHLTSVEVKDVVNNCDGTFTFTVKACIGLNDNFGATKDITLIFSGGTFSRVTTLITATLNASFKVCNQNCDVGTKSCLGTILDVNTIASGIIQAPDKVYFNSGVSNPIGYNLVENDEIAGCISTNPESICFDIQLTTKGYPTQVELTGYENNCIPPFCQQKIVSTPSAPCCQPQISFTSVPASCQGVCNGSSKANVTGMPPTFSYFWSPTAQLSETAVDLCLGDHTVQVTDSMGCSNTAQVSILPAVTINLTSVVKNVDCVGGSNGEINLTMNNGTSPYLFNWSSADSVEDLDSLKEGEYFVTVTDANGCIAMRSDSVKEIASITLTLTKTDATCGNNDGTATVTPAGGYEPYLYSWDSQPPQMDSSATNLPVGNFFLTVTDSKGCAAVGSVSIKNQNAPEIAGNSIDVRCFNGMDGMVNILVSMGSPPYDFLWSDSDTNQNLANKTAGTYTLTVTDKNGCMDIKDFTLNQPTAIEDSIVYSNITCFGYDDGWINLFVTGGVPGYSFTWSNLENTANIDKLEPGDYSFTITDSKGCVLDTNQLILEPSILDLTTVITSPDCNGATNGSITASLSGGTPPYFYLWSDFQFGPTAVGINAGHYSVTSWDNNGCTVIRCLTVNEKNAPLITLTDIQGTLCNGVANGFIDVTISGGTSPYTYQWSNNETTEDINGLPAANYELTVTDANGCRSMTDCGGVTLDQPNQLEYIMTKTDANCGASDGSATIQISGGTRPYTYSWAPNLTQTDSVATGLSFGTYNVFFGDSNGCQGVAIVKIRNLGGITVDTTDNKDILCFGLNNGSINITCTGGMSPPYSYSWSTGPTTEDLTGLSKGKYVVTVTDASNCLGLSDSIVILEPEKLQVTALKNDVTCPHGCDGIIDITPSGGTLIWWWPYYTYIWSNSFNGEDLTSTCAGIYSVGIIDYNGCRKDTTIQVFQPPDISASYTIQKPDCGTTNGSIAANLSGGTPGYSYIWFTNPQQFGATVLNAGPGFYPLQVLDSRNCLYEDTLLIENDNAPVLSLVVKDSIPCYGDSSGYADVTVTSGVSPYTFLWSRSDITEDLANVKTGIYYLTVTGNNSCASVSRVIFTEPDPLVLSGFSYDTYCKGVANGSVDLTVIQGTTPYSYSWSNDVQTEDPANLPGGLFVVTVTDSKGCKEFSAFTINETFQLALSTVVSNASCNVSNGSITVNPSGVPEGFTYSWNTQPPQLAQTAINLGTGGYIVTVTSTSGCSAQVSAGVSNISGPTIMLMSKTHVSCFKGSDGEITVLVNGELSPFTISWTNGTTTDSLEQVSPGTYTLPLLTAGDYFVIARDPNGCKFVLTETLTQPTDINISHLVTNETCPGKGNGSIDITITGGVSPYSYSWNTGEITTSINNLFGDDYYVTVTDSMLCNKSDTINVPVGYILSDVSIIRNANCNQNDGFITVTPADGTSPYSFSWSYNPGLNNDTANTLLSGTYYLTITDNNGCILTDSMNVGNNPPQIVQISNVFNVSCKGETDGSIFLNVNGGNSPYIYSWSDGKLESPADSLVAGTYTVTVTDQRNCTATADTLVTEPSLMALNGFFVSSTCTASDGKAWVNVSGGTFPFSYSWDTQPAQITDTAKNIPAGTYTVYVSDANGCKDSETVQVSNTDLEIIIDEKADATCKGKYDGYIVVSASGGAIPYSYSWTTFENSDSIANLGGGNYGVSVTDVNGCKAFKTIPLLELDSIVLSFQKKTVSCYNGSDGTLQMNATGGDGNYAYQWSTGDTVSLAENLSAGIYSVTVNDIKGCITEDTVSLNQNTSILIIAQFKNPACGESNGKIDITPSGGVGNFTYSWNTGESVFSIDSLAPGIFSVTVTDGNNCTTDTSYALANEAGPVVNLGSDTVICFGNSLTLNAGNPGLSFSWVPGGENTQSISVSVENNYSVQVTDGNGCIGMDIIFVNIDTPLVNAGVDRFQCRDSSIQLSATGGVVYSWNPATGLNNPTISNPAVTLQQTQTYKVSATDAFGCTAADEITVRVSPENYSVSDDQKICKGDIISLLADGGESYSWFPVKGLNNPDIPEPQAAPDSSVMYYVEITDSNGCIVRDSLQVTVYSLPTANAGSDTVIVRGQSVLLQGSGGGTYQWVPVDWLSCYNCQNPVSSPPNTMAYVLSVKVFDLCTATDTLIIVVEDDKGVFVPNIFTPNNDGKNDIFYVRKYTIGYEITNFRFSVFDRWGNKVFETTNPEEGWDGTFHGTGMSAGVFVYTAEITYSNNNTVVKKGNVTLVR